MLIYQRVYQNMNSGLEDGIFSGKKWEGDGRKHDSFPLEFIHPSIIDFAIEASIYRDLWWNMVDFQLPLPCLISGWYMIHCNERAEPKLMVKAGP